MFKLQINREKFLIMLGDGIPLVGVNLSNINLSKLSMPGINLARQISVEQIFQERT